MPHARLAWVGQHGHVRRRHADVCARMCGRGRSVRSQPICHWRRCSLLLAATSSIVIARSPLQRACARASSRSRALRWAANHPEHAQTLVRRACGADCRPDHLIRTESLRTDLSAVLARKQLPALAASSENSERRPDGAPPAGRGGTRRDRERARRRVFDKWGYARWLVAARVADLATC